MGRSPCCEKAHTNKGAWTKEEDDRRIDYIRAHGEGCWRSLLKAAGLLRCGKSYRLRWINYLKPDLKCGNFTKEEDELIIKLHSLLGNKLFLLGNHLYPHKWKQISQKFLFSKTANQISRHAQQHFRRQLIPQNQRIRASINDITDWNEPRQGHLEILQQLLQQQDADKLATKQHHNHLMGNFKNAQREQMRNAVAQYAENLRQQYLNLTNEHHQAVRNHFI